MKRTLLLIVLTTLLLIGAVVVENYCGLPTWQLLLVYLVPYLLIGHDTLKKAFEGIVRGDMTSSVTMFIGYLVPALLGAVILIVDHVGGGESKTETGPSDAALAGQKNKKKKK